MLRNLIRDIVLSIKAKSGLTVAFFVWCAIAAAAGLAALVFLCLAAYGWLALTYGAVNAALIMAGGFLIVALIGAGVGAIVKRRARAQALAQQALLAQQAPATLEAPDVLGLALEAGRGRGWQRVVPLAVLGILALAQVARLRRPRQPGNS